MDSISSEWIKTAWILLSVRNPYATIHRDLAVVTGFCNEVCRNITDRQYHCHDSNAYLAGHRNFSNDFAQPSNASARLPTDDVGTMTLGNLWFLADEADQRAAQAYHDLTTDHEPTLEISHHRQVSRNRFRTLAGRIRDTGAPYGAHTIVYRPSGELLLCRHEGVGLWVLPGGEVDSGESFRTAAERELTEEAGVEARYEGLAIVTRVEVQCDEHATWGVLPIFAATAETTRTTISDPDDEISAAEWFAELPEDTRDREDLLAWRERAL